MRGNILVLSISGALGMFCRSMVFPYAPLFILSLGGAPAEIGFVYALGPLGGLLVYPIAGYLADHISRAKLIALTGYFSSLTLLLYIFAPSWHWLAAARLLQGFAVLQHPASSALIADSLTPESRGRGIATMMTFSGALAILAPYAAGLMLDWQGVDAGMRTLYAIMAIAYALGATINLIFIREAVAPTIETEKVSLAQLSTTLKETYTGLPAFLAQFPRTLKALTAIITLAFMANGVAGPFWIVYASDHIGLSSTQWGLVLLIEAGLGHLVRIPAGFLADRYGRTRFIPRFYVLVHADDPPLRFGPNAGAGHCHSLHRRRCDGFFRSSLRRPARRLGAQSHTRARHGRHRPRQRAHRGGDGRHGGTGYWLLDHYSVGIGFFGGWFFLRVARSAAVGIFPLGPRPSFYTGSPLCPRRKKSRGLSSVERTDEGVELSSPLCPLRQPYAGRSSCD